MRMPPTLTTRSRRMFTGRGSASPCRMRQARLSSRWPIPQVTLRRATGPPIIKASRTMFCTRNTGKREAMTMADMDDNWTQKDFEDMDRITQEHRRLYPNDPNTLKGIAAEKAWDEGEREHQRQQAAKRTNSPRK